MSPRVFISYSHEFEEHRKDVLRLSDALRAIGIDADLDQYHEAPAQGWPRWCKEQLKPGKHDYVLVMCTASYANRGDNSSTSSGHGVYFEWDLIERQIYRSKSSSRYLPILLNDDSDEYIPPVIDGNASFRVREFELRDTGFEGLYRLLTGQPAVAKPGLGPIVRLTKVEPKKRQSEPDLAAYNVNTGSNWTWPAAAMAIILILSAIWATDRGCTRIDTVYWSWDDFWAAKGE